MEDLELSGLPGNWLSLKPINISDEEEDDRKVILESKTTEGSPKPFKRSSEAVNLQNNRTCRSFRWMKPMHGHLRCHPDRGWRGANPPPALPLWGVRGKRGQKGTISNSSKKLKMEENYDSWKEFLTLGLNNGEEKEKEKEKKSEIKTTEEASSSSSLTSFEEKEESHKCKICNKSFLTGQALGGHQTAHRRNARPRVPADFGLNQLN